VKVFEVTVPSKAIEWETQMLISDLYSETVCPQKAFRELHSPSRLLSKEHLVLKDKCFFI